MAKKKATFLKDIQVAEVSIVPKAANNRSFLLFKSDVGEGQIICPSCESAFAVEEPSTDTGSDSSSSDSSGATVLDDAIAALAEAVRLNKQHKPSEEVPMTLEEILKAAAEGKLDNEDAIKEAVAKAELPGDKAEVVSAILRVAKTAELPPEFLGVIAQLGGFKLPEPEPSKEAPKPDAEKDKLSKEVQKLSPEAREELEKQQKEIRDLKKQAEDAITALKKAEEEREIEKAIQKAAKDFPNLPVKAEEFGPIMKSMSEKLDEKSFNKLVEVLKAGNEAIARSKDFEDVGRAYTEKPNDLSTRVSEIMKADAKLTKAQAIAKAVEENQSFYDEYRTALRG